MHFGPLDIKYCKVKKFLVICKIFFLGIDSTWNDENLSHNSKTYNHRNVNILHGITSVYFPYLTKLYSVCALENTRNLLQNNT